MMVLKDVRLGGVMLLTMVLIDPIYTCVTIGGWDDLVSAVTNASGSLSLCPFDIVKPESEKLLLNKRLTMSCVGATESNKCTLRGIGNHIRIAQSAAEVVLEGFKFIGATKCAVRVHSTATKTHELRDCGFVKYVVRLLDTELIMFL